MSRVRATWPLRVAPLRPASLRLALLLPVLLGGAACAGPIRISIAQAREHLASLRGGLVRVEGTVRRFTDEGGDYYVLEDDDLNRIGLSGPIEPLLPPLAGRPCRATGRLEYRPDRGFFLEGRGVDPL